MNGRLDSVDISVLALIMVLILMARYGGWRGWWPPRGPFSH
jgi:hypothetical protein